MPSNTYVYRPPFLHSALQVRTKTACAIGLSSVTPQSAGAGANDASIGTVAWSTPGNILTSNDSYATSTLLLTQVSNYLVASTFGFTLPAGSLVTGIRVEWEKDGAALGITDSAVRLVKAGVIGTTDRAVAGAWPSADAYVSHGSSTDLWGDTWTADDINAIGFGAALAATASLGADTAQVDHCRISVYSLDYGGAVAGRTTKNIHSFGLGMQQGMGFGMPAGGRYLG